MLPYYARPDLAWQETLAPPSPVSLTGIRYRPKSGFIDVPVSVFFFISAAGGAGQPTVRLNIVTEFALRVVEISSPSAQPRLTEWAYSFVAGISAATVGTNGTVLLPLPPVTLSGSDFLETVLDNELPGDFLELAQMTVIHIPTGPPLSYEIAPERPRATPLI